MTAPPSKLDAAWSAELAKREAIEAAGALLSEIEAIDSPELLQALKDHLKALRKVLKGVERVAL